MNPKAYAGRRKDTGGEVRIALNRDLESRGLTVRKGTTGVIIRQQRGYTIKTDACPQCGIVIIMTQVDGNDLALHAAALEIKRQQAPRRLEQSPGNFLDEREENAEGMRARLNMAAGTAYTEVPAGTPVTILSRYRGYHVRTDRCATCGHQMELTQVPAEKLSRMEES